MKCVNHVLLKIWDIPETYHFRIKKKKNRPKYKIRYQNKDGGNDFLSVRPLEMEDGSLLLDFNCQQADKFAAHFKNMKATGDKCSWEIDKEKTTVPVIAKNGKITSPKAIDYCHKLCQSNFQKVDRAKSVQCFLNGNKIKNKK